MCAQKQIIIDCSQFHVTRVFTLFCYRYRFCLLFHTFFLIRSLSHIEWHRLQQCIVLFVWICGEKYTFIHKKKKKTPEVSQKSCLRNEFSSGFYKI